MSEEEKKCVTPHVAVLALAEAGGLAELLPKGSLPPVLLVRSGLRIGELCQLLLLVLILQPGPCEGALTRCRDHSTPAGPCRNAAAVGEVVQVRR